MAKNKLKNLIELVVACVVAIVVAVAAVMYLVQDNAYAWFAKNDQVSANGMQTTVKGDYNLTLTAEMVTDTEIVKETVSSTIPETVPETWLEKLYPGKSTTITLTFVNNESTKLKADIYLTVPDGGETPIEVKDEVKGNLYYYLGSQIKVTTDVNTTEVFLLDTAAKNSGQVTSVTEKYFAENKLIVTGLELPAGETKTITITFEFVDNGEDQSMYIDFGNSSGSCSRGILAVLSLAAT